MTYSEMTKEELIEERQALQKEYDAWKRKGLTLNMARGKPSSLQLDLSNELMDVLNSKSYFNFFNCVGSGPHKVSVAHCHPEFIGLTFFSCDIIKGLGIVHCKLKKLHYFFI